jgi:hypothetical protein
MVMVDKVKVVGALRKAALDFMQSATYYRDNDKMLHDLYRDDARDVDGLLRVYEMTDDFTRLVDSIMSLDTLPRERVLAILKDEIGREAVEATGLVIYL